MLTELERILLEDANRNSGKEDLSFVMALGYSKGYLPANVQQSARNLIDKGWIMCNGKYQFLPNGIVEITEAGRKNLFR